MRCLTLRGTLGLGDALVQVLSTRALGRMEQAGTIPRERRPLAHAQGLRLNTPFFPHPSPARSLIPEVMDSHCLQKGSELLAGGSPTGGGGSYLRFRSESKQVSEQFSTSISPCVRRV